MKLYAEVTSTQVVSASQLLIGMNFGFASVPNPTNGTTSVYVTPPNNLTSLLLNQAMADALVSYVNTTYGESFVRGDVLFISGAVPLAVL